MRKYNSLYIHQAITLAVGQRFAIATARGNVIFECVKNEILDGRQPVKETQQQITIDDIVEDSDDN